MLGCSDALISTAPWAAAAPLNMFCFLTLRIVHLGVYRCSRSGWSGPGAGLRTAPWAAAEAGMFVFVLADLEELGLHLDTLGLHLGTHGVHFPIFAHFGARPWSPWVTC